MSRQSAASKAITPAATLPPYPPPRSLSASAKKIWVKVMAAKGREWFDDGNLDILEVYCTNMSIAKLLTPMAEKALVEGDMPLFFQLRKEASSLTTSTTQQARSMRLTQQATIDKTKKANKASGRSWSPRNA